MIAVLFALPAESSGFVRMLRVQERSGNLVRAELDRRTVLVLHTGVGASICDQRLRDFLANEKPHLLISSGFCGATTNELRPGELVVGTNRSAPDLCERARDVLPRAHFGSLFSAERVIDREADRYRIGREHGASIIDMETETIARRAAGTGVPLLSLRIVSDSPSAPFPAPPEVLFDVAKQRTSFPTLMRHLAHRPEAALGLMRFSRQVGAAKKILAEALREIIPALDG